MVADTGGGKVYLLYDATENEERVHDFGLIVLGVGRSAWSAPMRCQGGWPPSRPGRCST